MMKVSDLDAVTEIEEAFVAHWSIFGRWTQGRLHDENGVLWFETPIKHLPYNAVIRTRIDGDADAVIADVLERFRSRGVQFFWLVHPSARPGDLGDRLAARALEPVENAPVCRSNSKHGKEPTLHRAFPTARS